jgi:hemerythrin
MTEADAILQTGIAEIDRQHAQLVKCLDELSVFVGGNFEFSASLTALTTLIDYTRDHFAFEESVLASCHYPLLAEHIAEHNTITANAEALWLEVEAGNEIGEQLVPTIRKWIVDHINAEDIQFANFIRENSAE